ncbi:SURF1 family protein [Neotabrizicola sp. VNH66]|uniref:SURF1 family protein n=1 Tax=Neotabrizicola sp. VNH66 TaxID=3400918 RepID=UPI003BFAB4FD
MRQILFLVVCAAGLAVLLSLGVWQLRRLEWKEGLIAQAEAMIAQAPVPLPAAPDPAHDRYRAVTVEGRFTGEETYVLTSTRERGPGFLIIAAFETEDGRRILIDRGYVPETAKTTPRRGHGATVTGNLNWPDDITSSTPAHDEKTDIWFGRDLAGMAAQLKTDPVLVIARADTGDGITPMPATAAFRNDHLGYAVTWFGLAAVWAGMTLGYLWRIRRRTV